MQSSRSQSLFNVAFAKAQRLGQALMVPVSVLPAAGLMVALGRVLTSFGAEETSLTFKVGKVLFASGLVVFEQMSLIFAVGVTIGFTGGAGAAALAAVTGYFAFMTVLKVSGELMGLKSGINTGVFGGITVGLIASSLYHRFHEVKLHPVLGFFSGKRLVPIVSVAACVFVGLVFVGFWPPIQDGIHNFGLSVMDSTFGPGIFAAIKRLLIPVGLHHVFYPSFLYEFGSFTTEAGQVVHGEASRYYAGDPTAGKFMASEYPLMIFALPAAALAIFLRSKPENRKMVGGAMLSAALTSILTGITEPIEFAFTFVAPPLYLIHCALAFVGGMMVQYFDIHLGYTFSASLIDMALGYFNQKNIQSFLLIVGPVMAVTYFTVFYTAIGWFDFKTPGREDTSGDDDVLQEIGANRNSSHSEKAVAVLDAIGGSDNIIAIDACITRLRCTLKDVSLVKEATLKKLGASGMMKAGGGNVQIVFGVESDFLKNEIVKIRQSGQSSSGAKPAAPVTIGKNEILSPMSGKILDARDIPDPTFAQGLMGETLAIDPTDGIVRAPFDGKVTTLFRTGHALGLTSKTGVELLIHVGIDTVTMKGEGFKPEVKDGDEVTTGQVLIRFDLSAVKTRAKSAISPIVITNPDKTKSTRIAVAGTTIQEGSPLWKLN